MKNKLSLFLIITILISIPFVILSIQKTQDTRIRANAATSLTFDPGSTQSNPITKKINDPVSLDITVEPGTNLVTFVKFQIKFDPSKIILDPQQAFVPNLDAFPATIEGPITTPDSLAVAVSVGADPTKSIQTKTKLGTLRFLTIESTNNTPIQIKFTSITEALSSGSGDQAAENVLASTDIAYILITSDTSPTLTPGPYTPAPTNAYGTPSPAPSSLPSIKPEPTTISTKISLNVLLHGIGSAGDNPNPKVSSLSNKNPLHPQRNISVIIIDSNNQEVKNITDSIIYDATRGNFTGIIDLGADFSSGDYNIKLKSDRYLRRLMPGIIRIENLKTNTTKQINLVAGDVKSDNKLNILDYNILRDCGYGSINPLPLADPNSEYNAGDCKSHNEFRTNVDLNDNGIIDGTDYNLFLRELSVQHGD